MSYKCEECKDKGFITLLTTTVECDCTKKAKEPADTSASKRGNAGRAYWFAGYESYADYVADMNSRKS